MRKQYEESVTMRETVGRRIRATMALRGVRTGVLAEKVGTCRSNFSKVAHGETFPSLVLVVRLAKELDCTTDWLLGLSDEMPKAGEVQ